MSSPTTSLLSPPNPANLTIELAPKGGILINHQRQSDLSPSDVELPDPFLLSGHTHTRQRSEPEALPAQPPKTPILDPPSSILSAQPISPVAPTKSPRIRFAPLPDPRRPRSLSTGRNMIWKPTTGPDGQAQRELFIDRGDAGEAEDESAVDDDDTDGDDEDGERVNADGSKRGRGWSTTMAKGSWKGTKKLLTMGMGGLTAKEETYQGGGPLKKSVSTGGFIGASAFRFSNETERKSSMLGPSVYHTEHRRQSSLEPPGTSLESARSPVKMLNGRVYGSRRASEAAEHQRRAREAAEPAFIEWGHGKQGSGLGSNQAHSLVDRAEEEDGSGMEWVKRRREERRRREAEERQAREGGQESGGESDAGSSSVPSAAPISRRTQSLDPPASANSESRSLSPITPAHEPELVTPHSLTSHLPAPMIQVSDPSTSSSPRTLLAAQDSKRSRPPSPPQTVSGHSFTNLDRHHVSQAINISPTQGKRNEGVGRGASVFEDAGGRKVGAESDSEDEDDKDEEEREEEGTGDFEEDDEDEVAQEEAKRSTSAAAGVEIMSRHKPQN